MLVVWCHIGDLALLKQSLYEALLPTDGLQTLGSWRIHGTLSFPVLEPQGKNSTDRIQFHSHF